MLIHNLKVSLRSFRRHRVSFVVNFFGLLAGLLTVMFIYVWVDHEFQMDKFHTHGDRLYRLVSGNAGNETLLNSSPRFAKELEAAIPEIALMVNSSWGSLESTLAIEEEVFPAVGEFATAGFFELFSYPLIEGNAESVLTGPGTIVLSESLARKLFNRTNVVGEKMVWRWYSLLEPVVVSGVYKDPPSTSSAQFDYVLSFQIFERRFKERIERGNRNGRTFIKLAKGARVETVNEKIASYFHEHYPEVDLQPAFLIGYADYYLNNRYENGQPTGGRIVLVRLFIAIGVLILAIACINFMNLSTARAALRTREIGTRKVMGAVRRSLIYQYLTEAVLVSVVAGIASIVLLWLLFPFFEQLLGQNLGVTLNWQRLLSFIGIITITGLLAGSYPAFYLSGFDPLGMMRGQFIPSSADQILRKGLVTFQFGISLMLIVCVLVVYAQMQFIQNKRLGYTNEYIVNLATTGMSGETQQSFLAEARRMPGIIKASGISHALFGGQKSSANITWPGKDPRQEVWFEWGYVGYDMLELLEIELLHGRSFSRKFGNERTKVIINKTTWDLMNVQDPIGQAFTLGETEYEIIGVTDDFHFQSLHEPIKPTFFLLNSGWSMKLALRIAEEDIAQTIQSLSTLYSRFNAGFPFSYSFHDQDQLQLYMTEKKVTLLSRYAAILAIFISCLGLYGMTSFVAEQKSKELGIRKVLGAPTRALATVISKDFVLPIAIASVVGIVGAGFLADQWLGDFAYRIALKWWFFAGAIALMLVLALITCGSQIIKALFSNPIQALRDE